MSTEVECSQVDSGLTASSSGGGGEEKNQNTSEGQKGSERRLQDGHSSERARSPTDTHKKTKQNDKENDQSSAADSAVETVKRKVVEAPPPKVNAWTKRTTGRVPTDNGSSQEKGEIVVRFLTRWLVRTGTEVCSSVAAQPAAASQLGTLLRRFDSFNLRRTALSRLILPYFFCLKG